MKLPVIPILSQPVKTATVTAPPGGTTMVSAQTAAGVVKVSFWTGAVVGVLAGAGLVWWLNRR